MTPALSTPARRHPAGPDPEKTATMHHPTLIPDTTGARILELAWNPDTGDYCETESPVLCWEIHPERDPHPVSLLGPLTGLAWAVLTPDGAGYIPAETVFPDREATIRELRIRARELAGEGQS